MEPDSIRTMTLWRQFSGSNHFLSLVFTLVAAEAKLFPQAIELSLLFSQMEHHH